MILADVAIGAEFHGPVHKLSAVRILAFSGGPLDAMGWPAKNLHTDQAKAEEAGLARPIASGLQFEGYLVELLREVFGESWLRSGSLDVKYRRPVLTNDVVQAIAQINAVEPAGSHVRVSLAVWCCRADGEKVLVGVAQCLHPAT